MPNTTVLNQPPPELYDVPEVRLNPGTGTPFAVIDLGPRVWLYIHEPGHARAVAAAFTEAARKMEDGGAS